MTTTMTMSCPPFSPHGEDIPFELEGAVDLLAINDPLSEALAAVATEVKTLREQVSRLEGREHVESESLDAAIEMDYQI